jgi:multiple sugar transport system ATP-binding protein
VSVDPASRVKDGEKVELWLDPRRVLLFNPHTGDNITNGPTTTRAPDAVAQPEAAGAS